MKLPWTKPKYESTPEVLKKAAESYESTPEVLKKAAESKVFKAGTQMFWNHDTDNEESQRPEGDLNRLAAVTTTDARWEEAGKDGPGLYATAKVFSDYADKVKEMGPHIGLSIRAADEKWLEMREDMKEGPDGKRGVITALIAHLREALANVMRHNGR